MSNEAFLKDSVVYFNDSYVQFNKAKVSVASAPVQYGLSAYTACNVVLAKDELIGFRLQDHHKRLVRSASILGMADFSNTCSYKKFVTIINNLLLKNSVNSPVIVRFTYYIDTVMTGTRIHGLPTSLTAFLLPFGDYFLKPMLDVCVSSWRRISDDALPARAKITGSYVNSSLMKSEALQNGYDDCIALDSHGHVAEGAVANIFIVRDGILLTPSMSTDILEGITRDTVIKIAQSLKIPVIERSIDRSELYVADEIFFSGSSARIWPITSVDKRIIGSKKGIGLVTKRIADAYTSVQHKELLLNDSWYTSLSSKIKS